jgi:heptosyltransferase-2
MEPKRILIMRLDKIGDVMLSTPVLRAVREAYPKSHIAVMVRPYAEDIVRGNPYIDELIIYDKDSRYKSFWATAKFALTLRKKRFDLALVLHPSNRSHIIAYLAGIPARVGYDTKMAFLLTKRIPHTKQFALKHEIDYTLGLLRYIGIEPASRELCMPIRGESESEIKEIFKANGIEEGARVIVIHPGASCPSRIWPPERFAAVADTLAEKYAVRVIIVVGKKEQEFGDSVAELTKSRAVNLSGRISVSELASVIKRSRLLVSNSSGPVHIACALGVPTVVIFGRNDRGASFVRWGPVGANNIMLTRDVGCEVCAAHHCRRDFKCLYSITTDDVLRACDSILAAS